MSTARSLGRRCAHAPPPAVVVDLPAVAVAVGAGFEGESWTHSESCWQCCRSSKPPEKGRDAGLEDLYKASISKVRCVLISAQFFFLFFCLFVCLFFDCLFFCLFVWGGGGGEGLRFLLTSVGGNLPFDKVHRLQSEAPTALLRSAAGLFPVAVSLVV